jgi:hypothetical protein
MVFDELDLRKAVKRLIILCTMLNGAAAISRR